MYLKEYILSFASHGRLIDYIEMALLGRLTNQTEEQKHLLAESFQ